MDGFEITVAQSGGTLLRADSHRSARKRIELDIAEKVTPCYQRLNSSER